MTEAEGWAAIPRAMLYDPDVPQEAKLVFLAISSHIGQDGTAWPSLRTLASYLRMSRNTISRQLDWLRERGYLTWKPQTVEGVNGRGAKSHRYQLLVGPLGGAPESQGGSEEIRSGSDGSQGGSRRNQGGSAGEPERASLTNTKNKNPSSAPRARTSKAIDEPVRPEVVELCELLADRIEGNGSKRPNVTKGWVDACRLLLDRDGRTPDKVRNAIEWSQANPFWRANVMSMPKLREKYDQLRLAAQRERDQASGIRSAAASGASLAAVMADPLRGLR